MSEEMKPATEASQDELADMIAEADTGGRNPTGISAKVLWGVPLAWALFQLWEKTSIPIQKEN